MKLADGADGSSSCRMVMLLLECASLAHKRNLRINQLCGERLNRASHVDHACRKQSCTTDGTGRQRNESEAEQLHIELAETMLMAQPYQ